MFTYHQVTYHVNHFIIILAIELGYLQAFKCTQAVFASSAEAISVANLLRYLLTNLLHMDFIKLILLHTVFSCCLISSCGKNVSGEWHTVHRICAFHSVCSRKTVLSKLAGQKLPGPHLEVEPSSLFPQPTYMLDRDQEAYPPC